MIHFKLYITIYILYFLIFKIYSSEETNWKIIDSNGSTVLYIEYPMNTVISENKLITKFKDKSYSIVNLSLQKSTRILNSDISFGGIGDSPKFHNGLAPYYSKSSQKYGYINEDGDVIINTKYDIARNFSGDYTIVGFGNTIGVPPYSFEFRVINEYNQYILPKKYEPQAIFDNKIVVNSKNIDQNVYFGSIITVDNGKLIVKSVSPYYILYTHISNSNYFVIKKDGLFGIMDWSGKIWTKPLYIGILSLSIRGDAIVLSADQDEIFIADKTGGIILPAQKNIEYRYDISDELFVYEKNRKQGIINRKGKVILKATYESISYIDSNGLISVSLKSKCGYMNIKGGIIIPIQYEVCYPFSEGVAIVK